MGNILLLPRRGNDVTNIGFASRNICPKGPRRGNEILDQRALLAVLTLWAPEGKKKKVGRCPEGARAKHNQLPCGPKGGPASLVAPKGPLWAIYCSCPEGATTPALRAPKGPFRQKSVQHLKVQYALCAYWLCQETRHI